MLIGKKIDDRMENLLFYTWKVKNGLIVPTPVDKVIEKADESRHFGPIEKHLIEMSTSIHARQNPVHELLGLDQVQKEINYFKDVTTNRHVRLMQHLRPSRWARYTKLGMPVEAMWENKYIADDGYQIQPMIR